MKMRFLLLALCFFSLCIPPSSSLFGLSTSEIREQILVVVNNHVITRKSFQQAVEQESASLYRRYNGKQLDEMLKDTREKTLQGLIDAFILEDKAKEMGALPISDEQIIEDIKKQNNLATDADLEKALKANYGIGIPEWLRQQKQGIYQHEVFLREVYSKIAIEDQELRAYYEDHKDEYKQPSRFRIRELVLGRGDSPTEIETTRNKIAEIQNKLKNGITFEELVKEYSISPSSGTNGDLGWMNKGIIREDIEKTALSLKLNQVSNPIETVKDYCFIQLIGLEEESTKPFSEVKPEILKKLQEPKAENAKQNYLQGLRVRANIRYIVTKEIILKG